jgi:hypothetical integral membrane protein (TIGR02206 family)
VQLSVLAVVSPGAYWGAVGATALAIAGVCWAGLRRPGRWRVWLADALGLVLLADAASFVVSEILAGDFDPRTDLPLALCDMGVLVAAAACLSRQHLLVEITWFWGLAGTLQGLLTPDLDVGFPHLAFFEYVVGHAGIVLAACFLVIGFGLHPRRRAAPRVFLLTLAYTALVGTVDGLTGANYMFLRQPPPEWTLLSVLGPWPWYIAGAAGVAVVLLTVLDLPFWAERRRAARAAQDQPAGPPPALRLPAASPRQ